MNKMWWLHLALPSLVVRYDTFEHEHLYPLMTHVTPDPNFYQSFLKVVDSVFLFRFCEWSIKCQIERELQTKNKYAFSFTYSSNLLVPSLVIRYRSFKTQQFRIGVRGALFVATYADYIKIKMGFLIHDCVLMQMLRC